jgi:hypothetical protein
MARPQRRASFLAVLVLLLVYPVPTSALFEQLTYALTEIINFILNRIIGPKCKTLPTIPDFDFNRYIARSWFTQKFQATEYIDYSERFCMVETYFADESAYQKATIAKFHTGQGGGGVNVNPYLVKNRCLTPYGDKGGQFKVAFCFLPSFLIFLGGPWYVVDTDYDNYAIVTAGPLTKRSDCDDASGLCTVPNRGELADPGSWFGQRQGIYFFTRAKMPSAALMAQIEQKALDLGICTVAMIDTVHKDCTYEGAEIKP